MLAVGHVHDDRGGLDDTAILAIAVDADLPQTLTRQRRVHVHTEGSGIAHPAELLVHEHGDILHAGVLSGKDRDFELPVNLRTGLGPLDMEGIVAAVEDRLDARRCLAIRLCRFQSSRSQRREAQVVVETVLRVVTGRRNEQRRGRNHAERAARHAIERRVHRQERVAGAIAGDQRSREHLPGEFVIGSFHQRLSRLGFGDFI